MTFRERYLEGTADFEEIFDLTDEWNFSDDPRTLREYLGLTEEEEDVWISESDEALETLMEKEKTRMLFLTDLDGTLLDDHKQISENTRRELERILARGHVICLATGRAMRSALQMAQKLDLTGPGCYIIAYNGGQIYDIHAGRLIFSASIPLDLVRVCFDEAKSFGINIQAYDEENVLIETMLPDVERYCQIQRLPWRLVENVCDELPGSTPKMLVTDMDHEPRVHAFRDILAPKVEGKLDLFLSQPTYLEIVPPNIHKGNALKMLCDYLGIPISHTVAAGDAENDLKMLQAAHIGVCMINGDPAVKEKADYVTTLDNNHDGAAEILQKFFP